MIKFSIQIKDCGATLLCRARLFNRAAIANATANQLIITNAHPTGAGDYFASS